MFPPFFGRESGPGVGSAEELRLSFEAYQKEFAKLQSCPPNQLSQSMSGLLGLHAQSANSALVNNNNNTSSNNNNTSSNSNSASATGQPAVPVSNGIIQDLSLPKSERKPTDSSLKLPNGDLSNDKIEFKKELSSASDSFSDSVKHTSSAFSIVRPKTEPGK